MSLLGPRDRLRLLGATRVAVGAGWLVALAGGQAFCGGALPRAGRTAAFALAARDLAQGGLLLTRPDPASAEAGAVVDVLHGVSLLPVMALAPRYRRAAAVSAAVAVTWVGAAVAALGGAAVRSQR